MSHVDIFVLLFILVGQWQLGRTILAAAARRYARRAVAWFAGALALLEAAALAGFVVGLPQLRGLPLLSVRSLALFSGFACIWLFLSSAAYFVYRAFAFLATRIAFDPTRRRVLQTAGGAVIASPCLVVGYGALVQRTDFHVRELDVPVPGLPRDLEGLRLVQVTDIHLSPFLSEAELARVIDAANETRAHVALVTGDLISSRGDPLDACLRQLGRLRAEAGVLGCLGNHEIYADAQEYATEQAARRGIRFLRQAAVQLRFGAHFLNFAGVDYQPIKARRRYLEGAERLVAPGCLNILLSHNPDVFPVAARKGFDLTIAGHTHGGQVGIEILHRSINPARFITPFVYGLYRVQAGGKSASGYVSRGIGTIGVPLRIGAPPEVAVLRLRKA